MPFNLFILMKLNFYKIISLFSSVDDWKCTAKWSPSFERSLVWLIATVKQRFTWGLMSEEVSMSD
jgi:uncharacterized SAM-dependent methyltransferase